MRKRVEKVAENPRENWHFLQKIKLNEIERRAVRNFGRICVKIVELLTNESVKKTMNIFQVGGNILQAEEKCERKQLKSWHSF